jgi:hypothetical protein
LRTILPGHRRSRNAQRLDFEIPTLIESASAIATRTALGDQPVLEIRERVFRRLGVNAVARKAANVECETPSANVPPSIKRILRLCEHETGPDKKL